jgi:catechol 2,3-dioxygenase-like lactoylglutathione lyase family enzyme
VLIGIDHVIVAVSDPDAAAAELEDALGLVARGGGRHDAHGTRNRLIWLGDSYLELMGVFDAELASRSWWGTHIQSVLAKGSDGYAGVVLATDDLVADVERLRASGSPLGDPSEGQRVRSDGDVVRWRSARPPAPDADVGLIFAIEHDTSCAEWRAEDRAARAVEEMQELGRVRLARIEFPVTDVARTSLRLLRDFGVQFRPSLAGGGARDASLGSQLLRLRPDRSGSPPTIALRASSLSAAPRRAPVLGCDWVIEAA